MKTFGFGRVQTLDFNAHHSFSMYSKKGSMLAYSSRQTSSSFRPKTEKKSGNAEKSSEKLEKSQNDDESIVVT